MKDILDFDMTAALAATVTETKAVAEAKAVSTPDTTVDIADTTTAPDAPAEQANGDLRNSLRWWLDLSRRAQTWTFSREEVLELFGAGVTDKQIKDVPLQATAKARSEGFPKADLALRQARDYVRYGTNAPQIEFICNTEALDARRKELLALDKKEKYPRIGQWYAEHVTSSGRAHFEDSMQAHRKELLATCIDELHGKKDFRTRVSYLEQSVPSVGSSNTIEIVRSFERARWACGHKRELTARQCPVCAAFGRLVTE